MKTQLLAYRVVLIVGLSLASAAQAASSYSNTLTGFTGDSSQAGTQTALAGAGLQAYSTDAGPHIVFDASGAIFGSAIAGDGGRNYLRTVQSDYATASFTAEITFTNNDDRAVFIGLGTGDTALFGTPDWSTQASSTSFWMEPANNKFTRFRTANDVNAFSDTNVAGFDAGTHRFRMTFDAAAKTLTGEIDLNYFGGAFVADTVTANLPINVTSLFAADGWPGEPSRIFFGGDDGASFRDLVITVVPEPGTAAATVIGLLACLRRASIRRA